MRMSRIPHIGIRVPPLSEIVYWLNCGAVLHPKTEYLVRATGGKRRPVSLWVFLVAQPPPPTPPTPPTPRIAPLFGRGRRVVQVSLGPHHSAALTQKGEVFTWGQAARGAYLRRPPALFFQAMFFVGS